MVARPVNPQIQPQNEPYYGFFSRPISQPAPNREIGVAIASAGDALATGIKGVDELNKATIDNALYNSVDQQREGFTGALETIAGIPQDQRIGTQPDNVTSGVPTTPDLIPGSVASPVPAGLQKGLDRASTIQSAGVSGKLRNTPYLANLNVIAKDLRSQYPGYREYIDQKMAQITGGNPANQYMQSLLSQINTNLTQNKSDTDKALTMLNAPELQNMPGISNVVQAVASGRTGENPVAYVLEHTQNWRSTLADYSRNQARIANENASLQQKQIAATQNLTNFGTKTLGTAVGTFWNSTTLNLSQLQTLVEDAQSGKVQLNEQQGQQLSQGVHAMIASVKAQIIAQATSSSDPKIQSAASIMTMEKVNQTADQIVAPLQHIADLVDNKEYGLAYRSTNAIKALTSDVGISYMTSTNTTVKNYFQNSAAINKIAGSQAAAGLLKTAIAEGLPTALKSVVENQSSRIVAQPDPTKQFTLQGELEKLKAGDVGKSNKAENGAYNSLINLPKAVSTVKGVQDQAVVNVFNGSYGPGNENIVKMFSPDSFDSSGNLKPGANSVFQKMTLPEITDKAFSMEKVHPDVWTKYKAWVENSHSSLFTEGLLDLNRYVKDKNVQLKYDPTQQEFSYNIPIKERQLGLVNPGPFNTQTIQRNFRLYMAELNSSLKSLAYIAKKEGKDPNQYIQNILTGEGFNPAIFQQHSEVDTGNKAASIAPELSDFKESVAEVINPQTSPTGKDRLEYAYNFFTQKGYTPEQAAGIVGGLSGETVNLNTKQVHDQGIGYGIAGWNGKRLAGLKSFAQEHGLDVNNLFTQLSYVDHELHTTEAGALEAIKNAKTPQEAAIAYTRLFERPKASTAHLNKRAEHAHRFYQQFASR